MDSACGGDMGVKGDADKDLKNENAMGDVIIPSADNEDRQPGIFSLLIHEAWDFRPENRAWVLAPLTPHWKLSAPFSNLIKTSDSVQ